MNFSKDFKYDHSGDYLFPVEYFHFRHASTLNTFRVELLCFDNSYAFHLTIDNKLIPSRYRFLASNDPEIDMEFGFDPVNSSSKQAVLQRAIDLSSTIAKKYCQKPVTR